MLNDLGIFSKIIFLKSVHQAEENELLLGFLFRLLQIPFLTLCPRGRQEVWNFESLTREPSYSSFFSAWSTDFKNVFFEKIHWAPSEVVEVKRSFSRSLRPKFGFHLVLTSFHLEFLSFWILRLFDLGDYGVLKISAFQQKKSTNPLCLIIFSHFQF